MALKVSDGHLSRLKLASDTGKESMKTEKHPNDHTMFAVPKIVLIKLDTGELHLIDKVTYGFGTSDNGRPIDPDKVKAAGFEILGDL